MGFFENVATEFGKAVGGGGVSLVSSIAEKATDYFLNRNSADHQANLNYDTWKKEFDVQNAYNNPQQELARYAAVGLNPYVSTEGSSMIGGSTSRNNMGSSAVAPVGYTPPPATSFNSAMQAILALSQARGQNIRNSKLGALIDAQIEDLLKKAGYNEVMTDFQQMANEVYNEIGRKKARAEYQNLLSDLAKKSSEILLNNNLTEKAAAEALEAHAREGLARARSFLTKKEIESYETRLNAWLNLTKSQISANHASAFKNVAEGNTENALRPHRVTSAVLENGIKAIAFGNDKDFSHDERQFARDLLESQSSIKHKEDVLYYWRFAMDVLQAVVDGVMTVTKAGFFLKAAKSAGSKGKLDSKSVRNELDSYGFDNIDQLINNKDKIQNDYGTLMEILYGN